MIIYVSAELRGSKPVKHGTMWDKQRWIGLTESLQLHFGTYSFEGVGNDVSAKESCKHEFSMPLYPMVDSLHDQSIPFTCLWLTQAEFRIPILVIKFQLLQLRKWVLWCLWCIGSFFIYQYPGMRQPRLIFNRSLTCCPPNLPVVPKSLFPLQDYAHPQIVHSVWSLYSNEVRGQGWWWPGSGGSRYGHRRDTCVWRSEGGEAWRS